MSGASKSSSPKNSANSLNAISSLASESGVTPFATPDGQTMLAFGQGVVHVHRSVRAGKGKASMIQGTSGPLGFGSSESCALTWSLGNRLQATLRSRGSTLFRLTWKERATPSGRRIYALRGLGHRTSGSDCTSWPSPTAQEPGGTPEMASARKRKAVSRGVSMGTSPTHLSHVAQLASWPTPRTADGQQGSEHQHRPDNLTLLGAARSASWHTPRANDAEKRGENIADDPRNGLVTQANLASWATPTGSDHKGAPTEAWVRKDGKFRNDRLDFQADMASWNTPQATDFHGGQEKRVLNRKENHHGRRNNDLALTVSGAQSNGSPAETGKRGQLNPAHSRWLMGLPPVWCDCAVTAMQSLPRSRKRRPYLKRGAIKRKYRKPSEFKRIYGSKERVEFVKGLACVGCGRTGDYIENAHIVTGGTGRKADYDQIVPLCGRFAPKFSCHARLHNHGREDLELWGGISLSTEASRVQKLWELQDE